MYSTGNPAGAATVAVLQCSALRVQIALISQDSPNRLGSSLNILHSGCSLAGCRCDGCSLGNCSVCGLLHSIGSLLHLC